MLQGSIFLRLFWLVGITFSVVVVIQFTELPNGNILSSIVFTGKYALSGKLKFGARNDSDSGSAGIATSTYSTGGNEDLELKSNSTFFDDFSGKSNSLNSEDVNDSAISVSIEKARAPNPNAPVENAFEKKEIEEFSSSMGSNASLGSVSKTVTVALTPAVSLPPAASPRSFDLTPKFYSNADRELFYAKSCILDAATVENAAGLYAPIYRNISMFQRKIFYGIF